MFCYSRKNNTFTMYYTHKMYNKTKIATINITSNVEAIFAMITFTTIITTLLGCI